MVVAVQSNGKKTRFQDNGAAVNPTVDNGSDIFFSYQDTTQMKFVTLIYNIVKTSRRVT